MYVSNKNMNRKLVIKEIPLPSGADHPEPPNNALPKHEFSMGFIAPKGSGKTTTLMNLMFFYKKYFHTIVVMSPTIKNDEKWLWIKKQPLLGENKKFKAWVKSIKKRQEDNEVVHKANDTEGMEDIDEEEEHSPYIPEGCFHTEYTEDLLRSILAEQNKVIELLEAHGKTKHLANRLLLVFDDLVGSDLFNNNKKNVAKMLSTNHRHYSASTLWVTQAYKEIPRTIRTNFTCMIIFDIPNDQEIKCIYEENSLKLKFPQWLELYHFAVEGDHDFLYLNNQKPKAKRIMKNFDTYLQYKQDDQEATVEEPERKRKK